MLAQEEKNLCVGVFFLVKLNVESINGVGLFTNSQGLAPEGASWR